MTRNMNCDVCGQKMTRGYVSFNPTTFGKSPNKTCRAHQGCYFRFSMNPMVEIKRVTQRQGRGKEKMIKIIQHSHLRGVNFIRRSE